MTKQAATKQAAKPAPLPEGPAGKKQVDMNEIMRIMKPAVQADSARLLNQQGGFNTFLYWAMPGSTVEEHLEPIFWLALAQKFNPNDELLVKEELGQWRAHFLIRSIGPDGVDIVELSRNEIGGVAPLGAKRPLKAGPRVEYRGQHLLWSVFDGERELKSGLRTEAQAIVWLENDNVTGASA